MILATMAKLSELLVLVCATVACGEVDSREAAVVSPNDDSGEMSPTVDSADAGALPPQAPQEDAALVVRDSPADAAVPSQDDAATPEPAPDAGEPTADAGPAPRVERTDVTLAVLRAEVTDKLCLSCHNAAGRGGVMPWFSVGAGRDFFQTPGWPAPCGTDYVVPGHPERSMLLLTFVPEQLPERCSPHRVLEHEPTQAQLDMIADWLKYQAKW
jgi:hypothetical protein